MTGYCFWCQNIEMKQCCHVGVLAHLEIWVLVSEWGKGIAKRIFFDNRKITILLETKSGSFLWICSKLDMIVPDHKVKLFRI